MPLWLYSVACVVVPAGWGVLMYFVFNALSRRNGNHGHDDSDRPPPIDYSI
jgi:hypothetical protein